MEIILENEILMSIVKMFGMLIAGSIVLIGIPCLIYLIGKGYGKVTKKIGQLDKSDIERNKGYYREILDLNSPLIIGYLDNFELDKNKLIAELLFLKSKNCLEMGDGKLEKIDGDYSLKICEEELYKSIKDGKLKIENKSEFFYNLRELIAAEAEELELVKERKSKRKNLSAKRENTIYFIESYIASIVWTMIAALIRNELEYFKEHIFFLLFISLLYTPMLFFIVVGMHSVFSDAKQKAGLFYKRTEKGKEINDRLEGLKNYLKDYSMLSEREAKEVELWEDYLIYSVMFGQNKKIVEEYEKYIEIE